MCRFQIPKKSHLYIPSDTTVTPFNEKTTAECCFGVNPLKIYVIIYVNLDLAKNSSMLNNFKCKNKVFYAEC